MRAYHANPKTAKAIMTTLAACLVAVGPVLLSSYPTAGAVLIALGGALGGGAHVRSPGDRKGEP